MCPTIWKRSTQWRRQGSRLPMSRPHRPGTGQVQHEQLYKTIGWILNVIVADRGASWKYLLVGKETGKWGSIRAGCGMRELQANSTLYVSPSPWRPLRAES